MNLSKKLGFTSYFVLGLWKIDLWLSLTYSLGRAYRVSVRNRPKKRLLGLTYGETHLKSFLSMMMWAEAKEDDLFLELGTGTGRLSLMAARFFNMQCVGVDCISPFVEHANRISKRLGLIRCRFVEADIFGYDWGCSDVVYITATAFTDEQIQKMWEKCSELKKGARLLSLTHKPDSPYMEILGMNMFPCSWGMTAVYLSIRI